MVFDLTVFSALSGLIKLKNGKNTPKLTKIALDFVKIRYNGPSYEDVNCMLFAPCIANLAQCTLPVICAASLNIRQRSVFAFVCHRPAPFPTKKGDPKMAKNVIRLFF